MKNDSGSTEFLLVYTKLKQPVFNYVLRMIRDRQQCEDIVQDTFLKLFAQIQNIRDKDRITQWVFRTARNDIYQYYRTKHTHVDRFNVEDVENIKEASPDNPEAQYEQYNIREIVSNELDKLPVEQKEIFLLREYEYLSYREIAQILDMDEELVKSRLYKARTKLVSRLKNFFTING
jgi:RNA polymerase sigma-70 factor (ECF subfamily)